MQELPILFEAAISALDIIVEAVDKIINSPGLLEIMKCVLSIGNIMNQVHNKHLA